MSIFHRHNCLATRSATHVPRSLHGGRLRVFCLATNVQTKPGPEKVAVGQRAIEPPKLVASITAPPVPNDPSLQSTWTHRVWVATGCTTLLVSLAKSVLLASSTGTWVEPVLAGYVGYVLADLGSGVYHWGIDNYGGASTLVVGSQIEAFQGHHKWPWTITKRQFSNNLHALACIITFTVLPIDLACNDRTWLGFVGMFAGCIMFSQQFHAWAHGTKSKLPSVLLTLQDIGVLVSRSQHAAHHRAPYNDNYCIVSGVWNNLLDRNKVFEALEMMLYFKTGVRPRSWSEPNSDWTEEVDTPCQFKSQQVIHLFFFLFALVWKP